MLHKYFWIIAALILIGKIETKAQILSLASSSELTISPKDSNLLAKKALKIQQINDFASELYESNQFNGVILVADKGEVIFHKAYGWANLEKKDTLDTATPFRLASVSKQFTSMAIMILKEQGKLSYLDDIRKYLPELTYEGITIKNLLQHSSGLPDYFGIGWSISNYFPAEKLITNKDLLEYYAVMKPKLYFKPSKSAGYSNTGYVFLALIIERVSGMSYPMFLHKHIFEPLNMKNAFVYNTRNTDTQTKQDTVVVKVDTSLVGYNEIKIEKHFKVETRIKTVAKRRAIGYELGYSGYLLCDYHQFDGMFGEKGVCVSSEDLLKWDQALHENKLVSAPTLREAFNPSYHSDRKEWKYGYGWKIYSEDYNIVFHHGLYRGFRNYLQRNLDNKTFIVVLSNLQIGRKMSPIVDGLNKILEGKNYKIPKPTKVEKETLTKFREWYRIDYGKKM